MNKLFFTIDDSSEFKVVSTLTPEGIPLLTISGRLVGIEAAALTDRVCHRFEDIEGTVLIDLRDCVFFSSIALGFLYNFAHQRQKKNSKLLIVNASKQIRKMVCMMGMGEHFSFAETMEEAVKSITAQS